MQRTHAGTAISAAAGLMLMASAALAAPAGQVAGLLGAGTVGTYPAHVGDPVQSGDTIGVAPDGAMKLQMADGSVITAAGGSRVTVTRYDLGGGNRDVELTVPQGLLRLVVPAVNGSSRFVVAAASIGTATMRSPGGEWFIDVQPQALQAGVLAGDVAIAGANGRRSVTVPAHWGTRLEIGLEPVLPRTWGQVEFDGFIRRTQCCVSPLPQPK